MALRPSPEFYKSFRFTLTIRKTVIDPADKAEPIALGTIWSDVFDPTRIWLGCAHAVGRTALIDLLQPRTHEKDGAPIAGVVSLSDRTRSTIKDLPFTFERVAAELPFDLNAVREEVALEWVVLEGVKYGQATERAVT